MEVRFNGRQGRPARERSQVRSGCVVRTWRVREQGPGAWKEDLDGQWTGMQEDWEAERRRLNSVKEEFEKRANGLE